MLRFDDEEKYQKQKSNIESRHWMPSIDDIEEVNRLETLDTVWQIITGQAIYWGYEIEREYENDIHIAQSEKLAALELRQEEKRRARHQKRVEKLRNKWRAPFENQNLKTFRKFVRIFRMNGLERKEAREKAHELMAAMVK